MTFTSPSIAEKPDPTHEPIDLKPSLAAKLVAGGFAVLFLGSSALLFAQMVQYLTMNLTHATNYVPFQSLPLT